MNRVTTPITDLFLFIVRLCRREDHPYAAYDPLVVSSDDQEGNSSSDSGTDDDERNKDDDLIRLEEEQEDGDVEESRDEYDAMRNSARDEVIALNPSPPEPRYNVPIPPLVPREPSVEQTRARRIHRHRRPHVSAPLPNRRVSNELGYHRRKHAVSVPDLVHLYYHRETGNRSTVLSHRNSNRRSSGGSDRGRSKSRSNPLVLFDSGALPINSASLMSFNVPLAGEDADVNVDVAVAASAPRKKKKKPKAKKQKSFSFVQFAREHLQREDDVVENDEEESCVICMNKQRSIVFGPCNHLCACAECVRHLIGNDDDDNNIDSGAVIQCLMCRGAVHQMVRVYR